MTTEPPGGRPGPLRSLRTRITAWYGLILAVCLIAYSSAVGLTFTAHVEGELDRRVHEDIELAVRSLIVDESGRSSWPAGMLGKQIDEEEGGGHWIEIWTTTGVRLLATGSMPDPELGPPSPAHLAHDPGRTVIVPAGTVRVQTEEVSVRGQALVARAAVSESAVRAAVRELWTELIGLSLAVLTLGGVGGYVLARRALGPLSRMAENARRITAEQLHERLPEEASSAELDQLRRAFNDTLARLEASFDQLRRFSADASHELRTPLTALRTVGEVGLRSATTVEQCQEVIGSMLEEVDRLNRLADELLTLARNEAGEAHLHFEPVDLSALVAETVEQLSVLAEERQQRLEVVARERVEVVADRISVRQALANLVDNAIKYSPEGTTVRVESGRVDRRAYLAVCDQGPGIAAEHRERVFDRFYRVDKSRSREMGGTGLGLSLVKWTAEAHGGSVELESEPGRGSCFRIWLPRERSPNAR